MLATITTTTTTLTVPHVGMEIPTAVVKRQANRRDRQVTVKIALGTAIHVAVTTTANARTQILEQHQVPRRQPQPHPPGHLTHGLPSTTNKNGPKHRPRPRNRPFQNLSHRRPAQPAQPAHPHRTEPRTRTVLKPTDQPVHHPLSGTAEQRPDVVARIPLEQAAYGGQRQQGDELGVHEVQTRLEHGHVHGRRWNDGQERQRRVGEEQDAVAGRRDRPQAAPREGGREGGERVRRGYDVGVRVGFDAAVFVDEDRARRRCGDDVRRSACLRCLSH